MTNELITNYRQQIDRVSDGVSIDEIRDLSKEFALEEEIKAGWQLYNQVVKDQEEKEAQAFMASESSLEEAEEEEMPVLIEDEFFRPEDLPKNAQNRQNFYNFTLMSLEGGVGERTAAKQATGEKNMWKLASLFINIGCLLSGLLIDIGWITKDDKSLVVDRSKMQRQNIKVDF